MKFSCTVMKSIWYKFHHISKVIFTLKKLHLNRPPFMATDNVKQYQSFLITCLKYQNWPVLTFWYSINAKNGRFKKRHDIAPQSIFDLKKSILYFNLICTPRRCTCGYWRSATFYSPSRGIGWNKPLGKNLPKNPLCLKFYPLWISFSFIIKIKRIFKIS